MICTKQKWKDSRFCTACRKEIKDNEKYESSSHSRVVYCIKCSNKPILVYVLRKRRKKNEL